MDGFASRVETDHHLNAVCETSVPSKRKPLVGFEVLTPVVTNSFIFLDITPCGPLEVNRHYGRTSSLHRKGYNVRQEKTRMLDVSC
jgi:hypothetical protein